MTSTPTRQGSALAGRPQSDTLPSASIKAEATSAAVPELADLTIPEATAITMRIRDNLAEIAAAIPVAYSGRAWAVLGYSSWDAYCDAEFGEFRMRLPREERQDVVASLRESGLSIRAIASATGNSTNTVSKDLQVSQSETPEVEPEGDVGAHPWAPGDTITNDGQLEETLASMRKPARTPITGTDGKTYPAAPKTPQKPRRSSLPDAGDRAGWEFRRAVERLERLVDDDRFPANRDAIAASLQGHLDYALDVLPGVRRRVLGIEPMGEEQGVQFVRLLAAELAVIDEEVGR
ncbi:MAG: hypothetical protein ACR2LA_01780 [Acidimicrobiales bacterium]